MAKKTIPASKPAAPRQRLDPAERERLIVEGAVRFFAEVGFDGHTRDLARRLGITQPLLYRYFPSKEHLIERVYEEVYLKRWQPRWDVLVADRRQPLEDRLIQFYKEYTGVIFNSDWIRIFMFAGLKDVGINKRYLAIVRKRLFIPLCSDLRQLAGLPDTDTQPLTNEEVELASALHGSIIYVAIRKWIYHLPLPKDLDAHVERVVRTFLHGAPMIMKKQLNPTTDARSAVRKTSRPTQEGAGYRTPRVRSKIGTS